MKKSILVVLFSILLFFVGVLGGAFTLTYLTLPYHEELVESSSIYYSMNDNSSTVVASGVQEAQEGAVSVHFLELGNKYTGDCTYVKVGKDIDILIDCGSKTSSISTVSNYLNQYVTDGKLEYVIITHAHQDHYAGFATGDNLSSIFDLYKCENIITFSMSNQKTRPSTNDTCSITTTKAGQASSTNMFERFLKELKAEEANGATHYTATEFRLENPDGIKLLDAQNNITLQILDSYYYTNEAHSENDYSVCAQINQGQKKFIFTGDLEAEGEAKLVSLNQAFLGQVEVYKAGHHGSKTSSSMTLLNVIQPKIVCVCCCAGSNEYTSNVDNQFPTTEFLVNISSFTTNVYVTTLCIDYDKNQFQSFNGNIVGIILHYL